MNISCLNKILVFAAFLLCCTFSLKAQRATMIGDSIVVADSSRVHMTDTSSQAYKDTLKVAMAKRKEKKSDIDDPVKYKAKDSLYFDLENKKVYLYGDAQVNYQNIELKAAYIEFDMGNETVYATGVKDTSGTMQGYPDFTEGNENFTAHWMRYNFKTRKGFIQFVKSKQQDGTLIGDSTKRDARGHIHLKGATYSTCDLDHPHFYIGLTKAKSVPGDKVVSGPAYFVAADIPLPLILPFGFFPNTSDFSSGLLMPTYGEERNRGIYLRNLGYYFGINEYMDARTLVDVFSNGSYGMNTQLNYKLKYRFAGSFQYNYNFDRTGEKGLPNYSEATNYSIRWQHNQDQKSSPNSNFSASVNMSSSNYDKLNSYDANSYLSNTKQSSISYSHNWPNKPFHFNLNMSQSQNSINKTVDLKLPSASFSTNSIYPFRREEPSGEMKWYENIQLSYQASADNSIHTTDSLFLKKEMFNNMKNGFQHSIPLSTNFKLTRYINFSPSLNYKGVLYGSYIRKQWVSSIYDNKTRTQGIELIDTVNKVRYAHAYFPSASLGYSPKLYGMFMFRNSKIKAIRHVMSPSVSLSYVPDVSRFSPDYYGYYDREEGGKMKRIYYNEFQNGVYGNPQPSQGGKQTASMSFSLRNNFEMKYKSNKDTTEKDQKLTLLENLDFNSSYNLMADSFQLSNIGMNTGTRLFGDKLNLQFNANFDPYGMTKDGHRVKDFEFTRSGRLARLTNASLSAGTSFSSSETKGNDEEGGDSPKPVTQDATAIPDASNTEFSKDKVNFNIPWSLKVDYSWSLSKQFTDKGEKTTIMQSANFSGDLSVTQKWKIGFRSGYDFTSKQITFTSININRDLHCWQMSFNWVPFGFRSSYNFTINAKAAILQDLKYNKRTDFRDNSTF